VPVCATRPAWYTAGMIQAKSREAVDIGIELDGAVRRTRAALGLLPHMPELSGQVAREYVVGRAQDLLNAATELNKAILQSELTEK